MFSTYTVLLVAIAFEMYCLFGNPGKEVRMIGIGVSLFAVYRTLDLTNLAATSNLPGMVAGGAAALGTFAGVKLPVPEAYVHGMLLAILAQQASVRSGYIRGFTNGPEEEEQSGGKHKLQRDGSWNSAGLVTY